MITVKRTTTESQMTIKLSPPPLKEDYRKGINTPLTFLNHMIEQLVWRSGYNVEASVELGKFCLSHVICEDLSIALGKAFSEYLKKSGAKGFGDAVGIIDEARAMCAISFESRAYLSFESEAVILDRVEDMASEDLKVFLDGFCQGAQCTMHIIVQKGENSHHIWEAVFRAFGLALGRATEEDGSRKNMTAGVAGKIKWEIEI